MFMNVLQHFCALEKKKGKERKKQKSALLDALPVDKPLRNSP